MNDTIINTFLLVFIIFVLVEKYVYTTDHLNYFFELIFGSVLLLIFAKLAPKDIFKILLILVIIYGLVSYFKIEQYNLPFFFQRIIMLFVTAGIAIYSAEIQKYLAKVFEFLLGLINLRIESRGPISFGGSK